MRNRFWLYSLAVAMLAPAALAEVYTLSSGGRAAIADLLHKRGVLDERIEVNGASGVVEVLVLPLSLAETYDLLRRFMPEGTTIRSNHLTIKTSASANAERLLFVSMGDKKKTIVYRLQTNGREEAEPDWPDDLPRPSGARVRQVTRLQDRRGLYAEAKIAGPAASVLRRYAGTLEAHGWRPMGGDGTAGIFFYKKRMVVIAAETMDDGRASILGVYDRHIKAPVPAAATNKPRQP